MTEKRLAVLTGDNHEHLTLDLPCESVFGVGQCLVEICGPNAEIEDKVAKGHKAAPRRRERLLRAQSGIASCECLRSREPSDRSTIQLLWRAKLLCRHRIAPT